MATALSDGYIYLIESSAADNQNWVPTPGNIDLDNFIQGDEYCCVKFPKKWRKRGNTGIQVSQASGGDGFMTRTSRRFYQAEFQGLEAIGAEAHYIDEFIMNNRHTATSATTFEDYYLIICRDEDGAAGFEKFTNSAGSQVDYCKGIVADYYIEWQEGKNLRAMVGFNFVSVW